MRWVQQATLPPHRCAVIPFKGNASTVKGFIDTGMDLPGWDPHVYVSVEAVEAMAKAVGWVPRSDLTAVVVQVKERDARIAELEERVREAEKFRESAEYTLGQFGAKVQRKPGRPPKTKAAA